METSKRRQAPQRVRDGVSRMAKVAPKIPPELPAKRPHIGDMLDK